ncbi:hypothetical protein [Dasania marina]|uniref:hypothetical protein n=1 Tax=Dasania marina TaxID=471499 RepID=UPI0030D9C6EE|tara:strand:+ start:1434 stop:1868 length:435 start_codon:yes stop_codon:yes gene_type:complete
MKLFNNVLLIATLAVVPLTGIYAQPSDVMSVNGMSEEQTSKMREHMEEMDTLLQQVKEEKDPEKRDAMLDSHVKGMEKMMTIMDGKPHGMGSGKKHKNMMSKGRVDANTKIKVMEERMAVMEEMMQQMMGYTVEKSKTIHKHKK